MLDAILEALLDTIPYDVLDEILDAMVYSILDAMHDVIIGVALARSILYTVVTGYLSSVEVVFSAATYVSVYMCTTLCASLSKPISPLGRESKKALTFLRELV